MRDIEEDSSTSFNAFDDSGRIVLSSKWHLRPNNGFGLVYMFSHDDNKQIWLSSFETVAIALFDGSTSLSDICCLLSEMLALERQEINQIIKGLLEKNEKYGPFLIELSEVNSEFTRVNAARVLEELTAHPHIPTKIKRLDVPLSLLLQPSYLCQTDCIYCYAERPNLPIDTYMSVSRWVEILEEAGGLGIDLISFGGGDPLTYPGIDYLLKTASKYHMKYILPTKTLITPTRAGDLAEMLLDLGQIQISVDSFDPNIAYFMTGTQNYAERARASITNLIASGLKVQTNTVITPLNLPGVESLIRELRQMGVSYAHITNYFRGHYRHNANLFLGLGEIDYLNELVQNLREELKWPELRCNAETLDYSRPGSNSETDWRNRASCSGGFSSCTILPNGDVALCEQVPHDYRFIVGNVARQSLMEVWNSQELVRFIVPDQRLFEGTPCADCAEFDICHRIYGRCFRNAYFNYDKIFAPPPNCPRASPGLRMS